MDRETLLNAIQEIGALEDMAQIRVKLTEVSDEISKIYDENDSLTTANTKFEQDNETLRQANMQLFLRVGESKSQKDINKNLTGTSDEDKPKRKFEDLFDEKGMIK